MDGAVVGFGMEDGEAAGLGRPDAEGGIAPEPLGWGVSRLPSEVGGPLGPATVGPGLDVGCGPFDWQLAISVPKTRVPTMIATARIAKPTTRLPEIVSMAKTIPREK